MSTNRISTFLFLKTVFMLFFIFIPQSVVFSDVYISPEQQQRDDYYFKVGQEDGYWDAMASRLRDLPSLCETKECATEDYERGYKLGYKKGMSEKKGDFKTLIDAHHKTIGPDFNGAGIHDFIVGASTNDDGPGNDAGAVYIFFGASSLSGTKDMGSS